MKKVTQANLSIGNNLFVKIEIKSNNNNFFFYVNEAMIFFGSLHEIKTIYDNWLYASEERLFFAIKTLNGARK